MADVTEELQGMFEPLAKQMGLSAFNMAQLDLYRLHVLLWDCNNFSRKNDMLIWKRTLDALYRELSPHLKPDEQTAYENQLQNGVIKAMKDYVKYHSGHFNPALKQQSSDGAYTELGKYEILLRKVMKRLGINLPTKGIRSALSGGD